MRTDVLMMRWRRQSPPKKADRAETWAAYCRFPDAMVPGNQIELLVDGAQAYPAMLGAIAKARRTILMGSYIFNDDAAGQMFAKALMEKALAGVEVYLIVDGVGTLYVSADFFEDMERAGVHVLIYRSPAPWRRSYGLFRRDHRKMLIVDGRVGFTGGVNIGSEWLPVDQGGAGWHDIHVRVTGPVVRELAKLAIATWRVHRGIVLDQRVFLPTVPAAGSEYASIVGSRERKKRAAMRQSYLQAIRRAKRYIYIANAYFLPGRGFRRALGNAVKRGVDVRVMVPKRGDILAVQYASQALWWRMLSAGVRIFLWKDGILHAKTAVIDGAWATVGSFNIDHRSWNMNLEVNLNIVGPTISEELRGVFLKDQEDCEELLAARWRRRPWFQRLLERFCFLFRRLM